MTDGSRKLLEKLNLKKTINPFVVFELIVLLGIKSEHCQ